MNRELKRVIIKKHVFILFFVEHIEIYMCVARVQHWADVKVIRHQRSSFALKRKLFFGNFGYSKAVNMQSFLDQSGEYCSESIYFSG